jgi:hypothetical protein
MEEPVRPEEVTDRIAITERKIARATRHEMIGNQKIARYRSLIEMYKQRIDNENRFIQAKLTERQRLTEQLGKYRRGEINLSESKQIAFRRAYRDAMANPPNGSPTGSAAAKPAARAAGIAASVAQTHILPPFASSGGRRRKIKRSKKKARKHLKKSSRKSKL